ncbi:MAG: RNA-dependent DNA polymerase [Acidobacteria bacterium]|nr:RNA-dependent DNA polymerase [Acidobacteriota bacterium]
MNLEAIIERALLTECDKLIGKFHAYHNTRHLEHIRNEKRLANPPPKKIYQPSHWAIDPKFNPFYVKSRRRRIARSIAKKIESGQYTPNSAHVKKVPKASGGFRDVAVYQIPDAAVSTVFYRHLLAKNRHRFSSFSYAYRADRNVHFAIQDIWLDISAEARLFVAEFDFSDFFGSISHEYLEKQFDENGFSISDMERKVIRSFLCERDQGIPQGTSISLFLANLVCWRLDQAFEKHGVKFARYADDTVVWSSNYTKICDAFNILNRFSQDAGIPMNLGDGKTQGISLLSRDGLPVEMKSAKTEVEFLGYSISVDHVAIKKSSVKRIKKQISYLLYRNLIQPLKGPRLLGLEIPNNDRDVALLTAMMQVRRYLFGGLTNQQLLNYVSGRTKRIYFKGVMSFYPLITDESQLKTLDGWLVSVIHRTVKLRSRLLANWGYDCSHIFPFNVGREDILESYRKVNINGHSLLEVPSFLLIHRALRVGLKQEGIERVMNPDPKNYLYGS